ncbi:hypothetical protein GE061_007178 [Apolygus lucorum]|uniref:Uncharacterized protein n=1 Tax=Apolygus lucorum TaxID=248454 RepID=A0A8S9WR87_APOLU|nr:hypothetical protein GE061_007178 [Apolygus lucorum]
MFSCEVEPEIGHLDFETKIYRVSPKQDSFPYRFDSTANFLDTPCCKRRARSRERVQLRSGGSPREARRSAPRLEGSHA